MLDTEINKSLEKVIPGKPLEAEEFFKKDILEPSSPGLLEPLIVEGVKACQLYLIFSDRKNERGIFMMISDDHGRNWTEPIPFIDENGNKISGFHISILRLKSGKIGMVYSDRYKDHGHPGRESNYVMLYRQSDDECHTWSEPVLIDSNHACCCTGHAIVLSTGRIIAPAFKWISPLTGNEAEGWILTNNEPSPTLSYSFAYVSDDEGQTWKRSLSELYISVRRAAYDLEEPAVIELDDGRILMHLRSEVGRIYRSYSKDGGISWTRPEALDIASAYTPCILKRIPESKNIIMVWNQSSRQENTCGLHRHRLSCAISEDEGATWENYKNLESLDDVNVITPPPIEITQPYGPYESYGYLQPSADLKRYHRAPGILRICYPTIAFTGGEIVIAYDIGYGTLGKKMGARIRIVPDKWFDKKISCV